MNPPRVINYTAGPVPTGAVYIGRAMPTKRLQASPWANPHRIEHESGRMEALRRYLADLKAGPMVARLPELAARVLVCWCAPKPCHGHVLAACVAVLPATPISESEIRERLQAVAIEGIQWHGGGSPAAAQTAELF